MPFQELENAILKSLTTHLLGYSFGNIKILTGGASALTFVVEANHLQSQEKKKLIVRATMPGIPTASTSMSKSNEAKLLRIMSDANVMVPPVVCEHLSHVDAYVMEFIPGETLAPRLLRNDTYATARETLAFDCGRELAKIHQVETGQLDSLLNVITSESSIEQYANVYRHSSENRPVFEAFLKYLQSNPLPQADTCLVHGDFRNGNIVVDHSGLASILDWELCHIGNPLTDFGWICTNSWRFGRRDKQVGGFGDIEQMIEGYCKDKVSSPHWLTKENIQAWAAFGSLKWGVICITQGNNASNATKPSTKLEKHAIWRRVSETEIDLALHLHGQLSAQEKHELGQLPFTMDWEDDEYLPNSVLQKSIFEFQADTADHAGAKFHNTVARKAQESILKYYRFANTINAKRNELLKNLTGFSGSNQFLRQKFCEQLRNHSGDFDREITLYLVWEAASQLCIHNPTYSTLIDLKQIVEN